MNYFAPKSFIKWGTPRNSSTYRLGNFEIDPINNLDRENKPIDNFYWCGVSYKDCKYIAKAWQNRPWGFNSKVDKKPFETISPSFSTEEGAVRWLEKELLKISKKKIKELNNKLFNQVKNNNKFLKLMEKF